MSNVIRFFSDSKDVVVNQQTDSAVSVSVTGTYQKQVTHVYDQVVLGNSGKYPRSAPVFASSSVEVYTSVKTKNARQRKSFVSTLISTGSESTSLMSIGLGNQEFVQRPISASRHEVTVLGAYYSGTNVIEGAVPYTSSLYYAISRDIRKVTFKLTASADMGGYVAHRGLSIHSSASITAPHIITCNLENMENSQAKFTENGKIIDIKIWVEILQVSGALIHPPLGQFALAVRSPNLSWGHAHPLRNYNKDGTVWGPYEDPPEFYKNSFLLWEPASIFRGVKVPYSGSPTSDTDGLDPAFRSPCWDRDMGMRTIFCDGAQVRNPRDIYQVYKREFSSVLQGNRAYSAPNYGLLQLPENPTASMFGNGWPWFDSGHLSSSNGSDSGSPPNGWLTGAGGVASGIEWPTTGSNIGPIYMRPVYPLLDDIFVKKLYHTDGFASDEGNGNVRQYWQGWVVKRPGLRGTDMLGVWHLMIANGFLSTLTYTPTYFRQVRFEITYEVTPGTKRQHVYSANRVKRSGVVPYKKGLNLISVISGSKDFTFIKSNLTDAPADYYSTGIYIEAGSELEINRAIGITDSVNDFYKENLAVYTSGTSVFTTTASYDRSLVASVLSPSVSSMGPRTLKQIVNNTDFMTTSQIAQLVLSGTI